MFLKVFIFFFLAAECKGNIFCNFTKSLCSWSNADSCHFQHETETPLAGKKGYLQISRNTCNLAAISTSMNSAKRFRFNYFLNGTGRAMIYMYAYYSMSGRQIIWQCSANQGPKWKAAEIRIESPGWFNPLQKVLIEVNIFEDVTVAIGNIEPPKNGHIQHRCPPSPPIIKPTTKIPSIKTTKIARLKTTKPTTPLVNTGNTHTMCNFKFDLCQWRDIYHKCHFKHVKDTPLLGETGYLMLSKDTCKRAALLVRLKEFKLQLHYLMNGTGNMSLSVGVHYGFAGRDQLWSCSTSQGPKWNKVDISVQLIHFDPIVNVYIDASVSGDATIAIGNIAKAGDGSKEKQCQSRSGYPTRSLEFSTTRRIPTGVTTPTFVNSTDQGHEICNFEEHLCKWSNIHNCHFIHETNKTLVGEKGYLYLSNNTCKKAGIHFKIEKSVHKFQLHYLINGTGSGILTVSANYFFTGRDYLWSCRLNTGPFWNKADILVEDKGVFDWLRYIDIEAVVKGDMTIAIGNISSNYGGNTMRSCPRVRVTNKPKSQSTIKPTQNAPKITTNLQTASRVITKSTESKTHQPIQLTTNEATPANITYIRVATTEPVRSQSPVATREKSSVTSQNKRKTTENSLGISYISTTLAERTDHSDQNDTVTVRNHPNITNPERSTLFQDETTLKTISHGINNLQKQQSSKSKQKALIIGGSVSAVILVLILIIISLLLYFRKRKVWDVLKSTSGFGFKNPLYK